MTFVAPRGVVAPILTPFNDDLSIATDLYLDLALRLLDEGAAGLAPFGTTGEALSVGIDERRRHGPAVARLPRPWLRGCHDAAAVLLQGRQ